MQRCRNKKKHLVLLFKTFCDSSEKLDIKYPSLELTYSKVSFILSGSIVHTFLISGGSNCSFSLLHCYS